MRSQIRLGRVLGVEVGLHASWFVVAALVVASLGSRFQAGHADWGTVAPWLAALAGGLAFFASLLVHEMSHALVARRRGVPVHEVTLFALGGVAHMEKESPDARSEFLIGVVGPVTSALLGASFVATAHLAALDPAQPAGAVLLWLGYVNLVLAAFNLVPGYPLDGGRVLRAAAWALSGDVVRATRIAARGGQVVAGGLAALGLYHLLTGGGPSALWLVVLGWFLLNAASASYEHVETTSRLAGLHVADVMARDLPVVESRSDLRTFVRRHLMRTGRPLFFVTESGRITGLLAPRVLKDVEASRWANATVGEVMTPIEALRTLDADAPVTEALEILGREDVAQVAVLRDGHVEGALTRAHLRRLLEVPA